MSKRYGRNQKRAHKEEIAHLKQAHAMVDGLAKHLSKELRLAKKVLSEMVDSINSVCNYSVILPPKEIQCDSPEDHCRVPFIKSANFSVLTPPVIESFNTIDLYALKVFLEDNAEKLQLAVHLQYCTSNGHVVYAISKNGLLSMPTEILVNNVAKDIAFKLVKHLKEELK